MSRITEATESEPKATSKGAAGKTKAALLRYAAAVLALLLAWEARATLDPWLGNTQPFFTFYVAVTLVAWRAGWRPALVTLLLGYVAAHWYFLPPRHAFGLRNLGDFAEHSSYFFVTVTITVLMESLRRARRRAAEAAARAEEVAAELKEDMLKIEQAAQAQRQSEDRFRAIFDNAGLGIGEADGNIRILAANDRWCQILGRSRETLVGMRVHDLTYPDDLRDSDRLNEDLTAGRLPRFTQEKRYLRGDGGFVWARVTVSAIRGPAGEFVRAVAVIEDISERKQAEQALEKAQQELAQINANLERMVQERTARLQEAVEELEGFSYSLAHDLRAPLRAMHSFTELLQEGLCAKCQHAGNLAFLQRIQDASSRMDRLVTDSLNYTKIARQQMPLHAVDLSRLLRGLVETYPNLHPHESRIRLQADMPQVLGNEAALTQCFGNLLGNAVKFVAPGVPPEVRVWAEPREDWVRVWVEDRGIGIPKGFLPRAFDMFQRAVTEYEGTGIGLAIVRKAAQRMSGQAGAESELGKGSRFWVDLQRAF